MIDETFNLLNLFFGIFGEDILVIVSIISQLSDMINQCWHLPSTSIQRLPEREQKESSSYKLIVRMVKINKITGTLDENLLNLSSSDSIIELNTRCHLNLTGGYISETFTCLFYHQVHLI